MGRPTNIFDCELKYYSGKLSFRGTFHKASRILFCPISTLIRTIRNRVYLMEVLLIPTQGICYSRVIVVSRNTAVYQKSPHSSLKVGKNRRGKNCRQYFFNYKENAWKSIHDLLSSSVFSFIIYHHLSFRGKENGS